MMGYLSKRDRGAVLFQTWFNKLREQMEQMDTAILELIRSEHETKRRLAAIEHAVRTHSRLIYEDQATVKMLCIACHAEFDVPIAEADNPDFVTTCPQCHNWALPISNEDHCEPLGAGILYSPRMIAEETGFSRSCVCQTIRKLGLRNGRWFQFYRGEELEKIKAALATKRRRPKNPGGEH